jgi:hypothetical protein
VADQLHHNSSGDSRLFHQSHSGVPETMEA